MTIYRMKIKMTIIQYRSCCDSDRETESVALCGGGGGLILDMTLHLQDCIMAEIREVMLLIPTHYGHSYLMHKISNNVLIIFKRCFFVYCSLLLQNMQLLLMYNLYSCTTISLIVIPSENLEVVLLFTVCYDGCITYQIII